MPLLFSLHFHQICTFLAFKKKQQKTIYRLIFSLYFIFYLIDINFMSLFIIIITVREREKKITNFYTYSVYSVINISCVIFYTKRKEKKDFQLTAPTAIDVV